MKSYDVWLDNVVNIMLPDAVDPESAEGIDAIYREAIPLLIERAGAAAEASLNWERYEDGDTNEEVSDDT